MWEKVRGIGEDYHIIEDAAYPLSVNLTLYKDYGTLTARKNV